MGERTGEFDVIVIGGGASGLAAAVAAARAGARTLVLERDAAAGLPILSTGNGRCNISNERLDPARYRDPAWARRVFGDVPERTLGAFFDSLGIVTCAVEGRLYPVTRRAASVRDALLAEAARRGVEVRCGAEAVSATRAGDGWELTVSVPARPVRFEGDARRARRALAGAARVSRDLRARTVVLAPGGASADVCRLFDLPHEDEEPVLCPIACEVAGLGSGALARLDGVRVEGALTLVRDGDRIVREEGEVLLRAYGISGIVSFDLSRRVQPGDVVELDLLPPLDPAALLDHLRRREGRFGPIASASPRSSWFDGLLARPLAELVLELATGTLESVERACHGIPLAVSGLTERAQAQVRRGGIPLDAVDAATLAVGEALYVCGEALDMDADCGGFNLAWAWTTGLAAGSSAAAWALEPGSAAAHFTE